MGTYYSFPYGYYKLLLKKMYAYIKNNRVIDPKLWGDVTMRRTDLFIFLRIHDQ
ncbi:hypothetical protein XSR1_50005 [Xenorhabdus szentirmaii DSM 16338]|uniref:Uncharacterized protein n=1 Tax=Xenorhabdus szentirmaii DSM 16338 TaxID=1427518 RepID=W1J1G8_9GAMM|nr:hypothetical protein XSR1_50005 [Xenorhabdus szentirmaii DSM 16338]